MRGHVCAENCYQLYQIAVYATQIKIFLSFSYKPNGAEQKRAFQLSATSLLPVKILGGMALERRNLVQEVVFDSCLDFILEAFLEAVEIMEVVLVVCMSIV